MPYRHIQPVQKTYQLESQGQQTDVKCNPTQYSTHSKSTYILLGYVSRWIEQQSKSCVHPRSNLQVTFN
jgi:hypothetical protein